MSQNAHVVSEGGRGGETHTGERFLRLYIEFVKVCLSADSSCSELSFPLPHLQWKNAAKNQLMDSRLRCVFHEPPAVAQEETSQPTTPVSGNLYYCLTP